MDALIIIGFLLISVSLSIACVIVFLYDSRLNKKLDHLEKQNLFLRHHLAEKGMEKINAAKEKSIGIIQAATVQAEEILKRAELLKYDTNRHAQEEIAQLTAKQHAELIKASEELKQTYTEALEQLSEDDINILKNISKDMENIASAEVKSFGEKLHNETIGQQTQIDRQIREEFAKANAEIEAYKKEKLTEAAHEVSVIIREVTKEVIGKSLTPEDHRTLILSSLEKAKKAMIAHAAA